MGWGWVGSGAGWTTGGGALGGCCAAAGVAPASIRMLQESGAFQSARRVRRIRIPGLLAWALAPKQSERYGRPVTKERLKALIAEYGRTALGTYFGLFFLVLLGFAAAFNWGFHGSDWLGDTSVSSAGVLGAAYVATKATQPIRIFATIALTPLVARLLSRLRPARQP